MRHLLPDEAKADLLVGAHVCRHSEGAWNSVSGDQFGEQTAIRTGKGGLKGMTLSPELVTEWIDSFPISVYLSDAMERLYSDQEPNTSSQTNHKEEGKLRQKLDFEDREKIALELAKHSHPLTVQSEVLYNIVNGQVAPTVVNVDKSIIMGQAMASSFQTTMTTAFHKKISNPVKTMEHLKRGIKIGEKTIFDLQAIFIRLLMVGQQRQLQLTTIFQYELCAVPPSLIDEYGCLRKGNKSVLANKLGVEKVDALNPDVVIVDMQQMLYHIIWPIGGDATMLFENIKRRLSCYPAGTEKIMVFDRYEDLSAKDHERMRRGGEGSIDFNLTINSPLPKRDAILKNKHNKLELSRVLSTMNMDEEMTIDSCQNGGFKHDEADVTMIAYLLQATESGKAVIRILSDDTDVFVLLVYWVYKMQLKAEVQMERWNGVVLDINATCLQLGTKCLQLLAMHAISGCDTVSYPFNKGKIRALNVLKAGDNPDLLEVVGEENATDAELMETGSQFFAAMYGQPEGTSMSLVRYNLYTKKKGKPLRIMALPPTEANLLLHMKRAHMQVLIWKAADQQGPPNLDITNFGWHMKNGIPSPSVSNAPAAPEGLIDVISCGCKAAGKACSTDACSCKGHSLSCTIYCVCAATEECCNPFTARSDADISLEENDEDTDSE